jgi:parallel beta-helix repeat protein
MKKIPSNILKSLHLFGYSIRCLSLASLVGCAFAPQVLSTTATPSRAAQMGNIMGGQQPVSSATVTVWKAGSSGYGQGATSLYTTTTDRYGMFDLTGHYACVSGDMLYLTSYGGSSNSGAGNNSAIGLMGALGECTAVKALPYVYISEATTIAGLTALQAFASVTYGTSGTSSLLASGIPLNIGTTAVNSTGLINGFALANTIQPITLSSISQSSSGTQTLFGISVSTAIVPQYAKLATLANILAGCVNTQDSATGVSVACTTLFQAAQPSGQSSAPADTIQVALNLASNPSNVGTLSTAPFSLASASAPFQPALSSVPSDWGLTSSYTFSPVIPVSASGVNYYVGPSGSDTASGYGSSSAKPFKTLQHAANVTKAGDTVNVLSGTYTNSSANSDVLLITTPGNASNWITYQAMPGQTPVISFNGWAGIGFNYQAAYIVIKGFTIIGNNANVSLASAQQYELVPASHPELNGSAITIDGRYSTTGLHAHHIDIFNNTVSNSGCGGIAALETDYVTIVGNTIFNNSWYSAYGCSGLSMLNDWNSDSGTGYKMIVAGNRIYSNREYIPENGTGPIVDGEGVIVDTNQNATTSDNAVLSSYTGRTIIANNIIYSNGSAGIEAFKSSHVDIYNNSTYGDVLTTSLTGRGEVFLNAVSDINVENNVLYSTAGQIPLAKTTCTNCYYNYNLYYNGTSTASSLYGAQDTFGNPGYVNAAPSDLSTVNLMQAATSSAVDSGLSSIAPSVDFLGVPRPQGKGPDRGAFEH